VQFNSDETVPLFCDTDKRALSIDGPTAEQETTEISPVCAKCGRRISAKDAYFPLLRGSYCVKCRRQIMRDRHQRLNNGIYPYRVIKPISSWQLVVFFVGIGAALAFLIIIEAYFG
jgi:hypothetical protein